MNIFLELIYQIGNRNQAICTAEFGPWKDKALGAATHTAGQTTNLCLLTLCWWSDVLFPALAGLC